MPHDVPWAVEQGSHPAIIGRQLAYMASQGQEGIADQLDCRVSALDVPGAFIRVGTGSYSINCRAQGYSRQSYSGRLHTPDQVAVDPTSSTGGRTDLVIIRIENPDVDGTAPPTDRAVGPYAFTRIVKDVPAGTTSVHSLGNSWSAITLARIVLPANTGTVQPNMITDLRGTKQAPFPAPANFFDPQNYSSTSVLPPPPNGGGTRFSSWIQWPVGARWDVPVPDWATSASMSYTVNPYLGDNTWGGMSIDFNGRWTQEVVFDVNYPLISATTRCGFTNAGGMRAEYKCGGSIPVTAADRGKTVPVRIMARTYDSTGYYARGASYADRGSLGIFNLTFKQAASAA